MRNLVCGALMLFLLLVPAACAGGNSGNGGDDAFADEEFPILAFEDEPVAPFDDSGLPATVESRVARTIAAQDAALSTAVAEGVARVRRGEQVLPTPTSLAEDEVRVPVFRRGGVASPAEMAVTPVPAGEPSFCPAGLQLHLASEPVYAFCYPDGWVPVDDGGGLFRAVDPGSGGYAEVRLVSAPAGSDARALFQIFRQNVAAIGDPASDSLDDDYGRYGLTYEYLRRPSPAGCLMRVTAKVHLAARRAEATVGYAVVFAVCDDLSPEYALLREGVLSGFREGWG